MIPQRPLFYSPYKAVRTPPVVWHPDGSALEELAISKKVAADSIRVSGAEMVEVFTGNIHHRQIKAATGGMVDRAEFDDFALALLHHFGIEPQSTLAATAERAWRHTLTDPVWVDPAPLVEARLALYGGLAFALDTRRCGQTVTWDVRSAYGSVMAKGRFPSGAARKVTRYGKRYPSIWLVRWTAPEGIRIPIIPWRTEEGDTCWLRGSGESWVSGEEIEYARRIGYSIEPIRGWEWEERISPFGPFIRKVGQALKDPSFAQLWKSFPNVLYGRFAAAPTGTELFVPRRDRDCEGAVPVGDGERYWLRGASASHRLRQPAWAVFITARMRLRLHETAYACGIGRVIAGHTDSLTLRGWDRAPMREGPGIGDWRIESRYHQYRALGPTVSVGRLVGSGWRGRGLRRGASLSAVWQANPESIPEDRWSGMASGKRHRAGRSLSWRLLPDGTVCPRRLDSGVIVD